MRWWNSGVRVRERHGGDFVYSLRSGRTKEGTEVRLRPVLSALGIHAIDADPVPPWVHAEQQSVGDLVGAGQFLPRGADRRETSPSRSGTHMDGHLNRQV